MPDNQTRISEAIDKVNQANGCLLATQKQLIAVEAAIDVAELRLAELRTQARLVAKEAQASINALLPSLIQRIEQTQSNDASSAKN